MIRAHRTREHRPGPKEQPPISRGSLHYLGGQEIGWWTGAGRTLENVRSNRAYAGVLTSPGETRISNIGTTGYYAIYGPHNTTAGIPDSTVLVLGITDHQLQTGYQANGFCSGRFLGAANTYGFTTPYQQACSLTNVPASITFFTVGTTDVNVASTAANDLTLRGFRFDITSTGAGDTQATRHWVTVGN